jgi:imidazolonepropionase-like amidohydrolase
MDSKKRIKAIIGATLLDGTGAKPLEDATILVEGGIIQDVGRGINMPEGAEVVDASGMMVMPGLIDAHVHLCLEGGPNILAILQYPPGLLQLMAARNALNTLEAGYTTVRDMGAPMGFAISLKRAIGMGIARGPRIVTSGRVISQTGGHADFHLPSGINFDLMSRIADGPDEVRKAAREQLRDGADWVKICSSGGVMSPTDPVDTRQFTVDEIRAAVEEANAVGKNVAAHAHGTTGIRNAVMAGVKTIEHGTIMDDEVVSLMAEKGVFHIPTLVASWGILKHGREAGIPDYAVAKAEQLATYPGRSMMLSHGAGVKVAAGTDAGTPFNRHGENAKELELMVEAGFKPMEAIRATTKVGAEAVGLGRVTGTLQKGKWADVIVVDGDPLKDIKVLQDRSLIRLVMKGGAMEVRRGL